jgi:predicted Fe-Mo cluster-binding NifX family protein
MASAYASDVIIAIPIWQERVSPVFDTAARVLIVRRQRGAEVDRREVALDALIPDERARALAQWGVQALLCGAISEPMLRALQAAGVQVMPNLCGDVNAVLRAFCRRRQQWTKFLMPGCGGPRWSPGFCRQRRGWRAGSAAGPINP